MLADLVMADPQEIREVCRGWVEPLAVPRTEVGLNPFTKARQEYKSWVPPTAAFAGADDHPDFGSLASLDIKGMSEVELAMLLSVLMNWPYGRASEEIAKPPLVGPPGSTVALVLIPAAALDRLASLTKADVDSVAHQWADEVRTDIGSIKQAGVRDMRLRQWTDPVSVERVAAAAAFASRAKVSGKQLYYWTSP